MPTRHPTDLGPFPAGTTLHECGPEGVAELAKCWREIRSPPHTLVITEEDPSDDVFFILSGRARAASFTPRGREVMLSDLHPGEAFGLFAAIDGQPRSSSVVAVDETRMGRMSSADFRDLLFRDLRINRAIILYLVDRIRSTSGRITSVASYSAEQRLIAELLRLAEESVPEGDTARIDRLPTQQDLALLTFAAHREAVGRDMSKLKRAGLIERQGRSLVIRSLRGLRARLDDQGA